MKKILLASIILTALFAQRYLVSSVYAADKTYTVGTNKQYATIQAAVDDIPDDLSEQGVQTVEVYAGGSQEGAGYFYDETVNAYTDFSNASASDYIVLKAMVPNQGKRNTGIIVRAPVGAGLSCFSIRAYTRVIGFGITLNGTNNAATRGINAPGSAVQVVGNVIYNIKTTNLQAYGIFHKGDYSGSIFRNNMIMDYGTSDADKKLGSYGFCVRDVSNTKLYNNTVVNSSGGTYDARGIGYNFVAGCILKNNYAGNNYNACFVKLTGSCPTLTYCISSDATADDCEGAGNQINKATANQFKNATAGQENLHLKKGADCIDAGTDLSGQGFTDDIYCRPRPYGGAWDVGAHEYCPAGTIFSCF